MNKVVKHPFLEWRHLDADSGMVMPWYTAPMLEWLKAKDISKWKVFEYGVGQSTNWWRFNCSALNVYGVDVEPMWAHKVGQTMCVDDRAAYIRAPKEYIKYHFMRGAVDEPLLFDVIIIDGHWRDECTAVALKCIKPGGYLIIDNYHQPSADLPASEWQSTDELLKNYPVVIFPQEGHPDWKTGLWQII